MPPKTQMVPSAWVAATPYRGEIAANTMYTASIGRNQEKHGDSFAGRTAHAVVDSVRVYDTALTRQQLEDDPAERAVLALDFETEQQNGEFLDYGSSNFVVNGLVNADRTPQPELAQLAYSHAPVRFEGTGEPGEFRVHNRNHTLTTEAYDLTWRLVEGGRDIASGALAAVAGIFSTASVMVVDVSNTGYQLEMDAILAVVIGGTSLAGGKFNITGAAIGVDGGLLRGTQ